jgi:hypothetical protein
VSVEVTAEGVTVSGDEQAPGGRRRLMETEGDSGSVTGPVSSDSTTTESTTTESTTTGDTDVPTPASPVGSDSTTTESTTTGDTGVPTPASTVGSDSTTTESTTTGDTDVPTPASPVGSDSTTTESTKTGDTDVPTPATPIPAGKLPATVKPTKFYLASNRATVLCPDADVDETGVLYENGVGVTYTKRDRAGLRALVGSANEGALVTSCTTGVTDMHDMFVRVPPSRVLLLLHRRVVVAYPLAPRSLLTPHGHPSLAAL